MTASETVTAFEFNLITEEEAVEQALCETLEEVYAKAALEYSHHQPVLPHPTQGRTM